jgi:exopolyphosphatase/guanosine-5'-triphosphate,3'-diphosphate pyrophosphatase
MTHLTPSAISAAELIAAVDLGSNSFHLVIARIVDGALQLLHREKQKVLLADGLDEELQLSEEAMSRGLTVLSQFADTLQGIPASSVRVIATYTLRRARNAQTFLHRARAVFPFPIEVISGQEEARFIYQGVAHFEHYPEKRLVMDIGGGSTEFAIGHDFQPLNLASRNMGCVSYAKLFFPKGKISAKRFERAVLQAEQELENICNSYKETGWQQVVGTSGTIKTIKDIIAALGWQQHFIELPHLLKLKELLLQAEHYEELDVPGLTEDRKQLLCPGLAILIAAFQMLGFEQMVYVDAALREGVLYEMSDRLQHQDIRSHTVQSLVKRYAVDLQQAERVRQTALTLLQLAQPGWQLADEWQHILGWVATLYEIGLQINSSSVQRHSAYILNNSNLPGFNQEQQQLLACLVRFHRGKIKLEDFPDGYLYNLTDVTYALVIFRLAILLNQKRRDDVMPPLQLTSAPGQLTLLLPDSWCQQHVVLAADILTEQQQLKRLGFQLLCPAIVNDAEEH